MTKRVRGGVSQTPRGESKKTDGADASATTLQRRALLQLGAGLAVAAGCGSATDGQDAQGGPTFDAGTGSPFDAGATPTRDAAGPFGADVGVDPPEGRPDAGPDASDAGPDAAPIPELTPEELLAGIETVIVVMMENRSFDHYLGMLKKDAAYAERLTVDGLDGTESNPDVRGGRVPVFKLDSFKTPDPPHEWDQCHAQWNEGRNDGFVTEHAGANERDVMGFYDRTQIPFFYWLADNFTICDRWFASVMGPTWPNRYFLHAASSAGEKGNTPFRASQLPTVWDRMKAKSLTAKNYYGGVVGWLAGGFPTKLIGGPLARLDDFFRDAKAGTLPDFAVIDPDFTSNDDHPAHDIQLGQAFVQSIYKALAASPQWEKCLLVITYDEHGGFYDHVAPPTCEDDVADFRQLGFRVPTIIAGPTVRKGYVLHEELEHASVAATLKTRFGIASLSTRMDHANDISGAIDPARVGKPVGPAPTPPPVDFAPDATWFDVPGENSQPGLDEAIRVGRIPRAFQDTRPRRERLESWVKNAEALGAIRVTKRVSPR